VIGEVRERSKGRSPGETRADEAITAVPEADRLNEASVSE